MKPNWTMAVATVATVLAVQQGAHAETRKIDCGSVPYRGVPVADGVSPTCTVQHVSDATRSYAVYREVLRSSPEFVRFIVFYQASKGSFDLQANGDDTPAGKATRIARERKAIMGIDGMAWAFAGLVERPPKEAELSPETYHNFFEARVPSLGGKLAQCTPTIKYATPPLDAANTTYAMGLACVAKDHRSAYYEDTVTSTLWPIEWGPKAP
mgnify:CR=1 FL=1